MHNVDDLFSKTYRIFFLLLRQNGHRSEFSQFFDFRLDFPCLLSYTPRISQGYGVIGNTSVSGTAIRGSSPCSPMELGMFRKHV